LGNPSRSRTLVGPRRSAQRICVAVDQLPFVTFTTEHLGDPQVHMGSIVVVAHVNDGVLYPGPVGDVITSCGVKNLEMSLAVGPNIATSCSYLDETVPVPCR
jgi:hypothetical protein